jgi:PIN like domain
MFDECIGHPMMTQLRNMVMTEAHFEHLCTKFKSGIKDRDWVPTLASEGGWIVITGDAGKQSKKREKLPDICMSYRVTHVIISPSLHQRPSSEKVAAIAGMWAKFELMGTDPPGTRYRLRFAEGKDAKGDLPQGKRTRS